MKILLGFVLTFLTCLATAEMRPVTEAEVKSFEKQFPGKAVFLATRDALKKPWTISATVDSNPQRGLKALCRMTRTDYRFSGRWSAGQPRPYAWIEHTGCRNTKQAVELQQQLPDADVLGLLESRHALLNSARILLAGNSGCASQRSFRFALSAIKVGIAGPSPEVLSGLVYKSDHDTLATVWARRNGADYSAWNVSCP